MVFPWFFTYEVPRVFPYYIVYFLWLLFLLNFSRLFASTWYQSRFEVSVFQFQSLRHSVPTSDSCAVWSLHRLPPVLCFLAPSLPPSSQHSRCPDYLCLRSSFVVDDGLRNHCIGAACGAQTQCPVASLTTNSVITSSANDAPCCSPSANDAQRPQV